MNSGLKETKVQTQQTNKPRKPTRLESMAKILGCTVPQINTQLAKNARQLRQMHAPENALTRKQILARFLDIDVEDIDGNDDNERFELGSKEYLVLTDSEADEKAAEYIKDSLWAFNSSFLAGYCDLPEEMFEAVQDKCESGNDAVLQCVERADGGIEGLIEEAISLDGRGHFLNTYDGNENEEGEYFIYRVN